MLGSTVFSLVFVVLSTYAIPLVKRDVYAPPITSPEAGAVWKVGETKTVTWDASILPEDDSTITNPIGRLVLGFLTDENSGLNLNLDDPLAEGFELRDGQVTITVPSVETKDSYILVLIGNSGNASPEFTIEAGDSSSSSSVSTSSVTSASSPSVVSAAPITATVNAPPAVVSEPLETSITFPVGTTPASTSTTSAADATAEPAQGSSDTDTSTDAAWRIAPGRGSSLAVALVVLLAVVI